MLRDKMKGLMRHGAPVLRHPELPLSALVRISGIENVVSGVNASKDCGFLNH